MLPNLNFPLHTQHQRSPASLFLLRQTTSTAGPSHLTPAPPTTPPFTSAYRVRQTQRLHHPCTRAACMDSMAFARQARLLLCCSPLQSRWSTPAAWLPIGARNALAHLCNLRTDGGVGSRGRLRFRQWVCFWEWEIEVDGFGHGRLETDMGCVW